MISYVTVLNRVKDFLPRMKEAEQQLEKEVNEKSPCELDIEYVDDSAPYIEMVSMKISLLPTSQAFWKTRRPDEVADYRAVRRYVYPKKISETLKSVE